MDGILGDCKYQDLGFTFYSYKETKGRPGDSLSIVDFLIIDFKSNLRTF